MRTVATLLCGLLLAGLYAISPFVLADVVMLTLVVLRANMTTRRSRLGREQRRGPKSRDATLSVLGWPMHALRALPMAVLSVGLALVLALGLDAVASTVVADSQPGAGLLGGALFALLVGLGPATRTWQESGRRLAHATLTPNAAAATTISVLLVLGIVVLTIAGVTTTAWVPFDEAPWFVGGRLLR